MGLQNSQLEAACSLSSCLEGRGCMHRSKAKGRMSDTGGAGSGGFPEEMVVAQLQAGPSSLRGNSRPPPPPPPLATAEG